MTRAALRDTGIAAFLVTILLWLLWAIGHGAQRQAQHDCARGIAAACVHTNHQGAPR